MDEAVILFSRGSYDKCLTNLKDLSLYNSIQESIQFLIDCTVCEGLICLSTNQDVNQVETSLCEICQQCIPVGYPNECVPLHIEFTALFNYAWWQLSTTDVGSSCAVYRMKWQQLLELTSETCDRSDAILLRTDSFVENLLQKLQDVLTVVIANDRRSIGIYSELIVLLLVIILLAYKDEEDTKRHVGTLIEAILMSRRDFVTLHSAVLKDPQRDREIFKFGLLFGNCTLAEIDADHAFNLLALIGSLCGTESIACDGSLSVSRSSVLKPIWNYLESLKCWKTDKVDQSLGLLLDGFDPNSAPELLARYHVLLGRLYSKNRDRRKAIEKFKRAIELEENIPGSYYFLGFEYGKIGLPDLMLQTYKKLLKALKRKFSHSTLYFMLDKRILELVHDDSEINYSEALYVLAVAYGLNEMFDEATDVFNALLRAPHFGSLVESILSIKSRTIKLPPLVTVLHEAAVMNLLTGNLTRCEELCQQAADNYPANEPKVDIESDTHGRRDTEWIRKIINIDSEMQVDNMPHYEEYVSFFDEDIIGLLIMSEVQRIEEREGYRITLNQVLLILSKQIARLRKDDSGAAQSWEPLVKALTSKTCLRIALSQKNSKPFGDVDKMFRRALSCNNGEKDILFHYGQFLVENNKTHDAQKLLLTFLEKESVLNVNDCESLALRYLLRSQVSQRDVLELGRQLGISR